MWADIDRKILASTIAVATRFGSEIHYGQTESARTFCGVHAVRPRNGQQFGAATCETCIRIHADLQQRVDTTTPAPARAGGK